MSDRRDELAALVREDFSKEGLKGAYYQAIRFSPKGRIEFNLSFVPWMSEDGKNKAREIVDKQQRELRMRLELTNNQQKKKGRFSKLETTQSRFCL